MSHTNNSQSYVTTIKKSLHDADHNTFAIIFEVAGVSYLNVVKWYINLFVPICVEDVFILYIFEGGIAKTANVYIKSES